MTEKPRLLYCHCAHAQVVPKEVKEAVLEKLCAANVDFECVADLCEASARKDPALQTLTSEGAVKIAACFPRAVKWLFAAAQAPLSADSTEILNMRTESAEAIVNALLNHQLKPNLPIAKVSHADAPAPAAATTSPAPGSAATTASPSSTNL